jgi:hypothetical protein
VSALEAGATRTQDAFSAAGAALERLPGKVLNATRNVGEGAWGAVRKTFTSPAFYSWGGYFGQKGTTVAEAMVRDTLFDPRKTRIRFSKRLNWNFWASNKLYTLVSPVGVAIVGRDNSIAAARTIGGAFGGSSLEAKLGAWAEVVPEVRDAFVTKPSPPAEPIDDLNANTTFADLHNRQHSWLALDWTSVAATTTTRVFSPFGIDRSGSAAQSLSSDKMVAGQVFEFDDETLLAFAERSVGGVGGDVTTMPNQVS